MTVVMVILIVILAMCFLLPLVILATGLVGLLLKGAR